MPSDRHRKLRLRATGRIALLATSAGIFLTSLAGCSGSAFGLGSGPVPPIPGVRVDIADPRPPTTLPPLDLSWLELDDFLPPGARRIGPANYPGLHFQLTPGARYPSTEVCRSPDEQAAVYGESMQASGTLTHWLMLENGSTLPAQSVFKTIRSFEVLWSPDSDRLAITHVIGENRSEVLLFDLGANRRTDPLDLSPALTSHFPEAHLAAPQFLKAYRWSGERLVIRGIGRTITRPHEDFGYEVLVDPQATLPQLRTVFIRGFTRATPSSQTNGPLPR